MDDGSCIELLRWALPRLGLAWDGFRKPRRQVCKRVARRMRALDVLDAAAYRSVLERDPGEWTVLERLCRVTISRFFRDRGVWWHLRAVALPDLVSGATAGEGDAASATRPMPVLRAWSAGCGSGEEPYSLSILWRLGLPTLAGHVSLRVTATDSGADVLERARQACYDPGTLREVPAEWRREAFVPAPPDGREEGRRVLCLRPGFRRDMVLSRQDIRREMPGGPFELVLCRNLVFTYFAADVQRRLLGEILSRLVPSGRLVLGGHERPPSGAWPLVPDGTAEPVWRKE